jgi:DNA-binding MarR family transcriptional regulator
MKNQRKGGFLISKIHQLSGRIFARMLKQYGIKEINPAQGRIMFVLWQNDGIAINELSKETSLGKSTLTSMLDRLEKTGFIRREASNKDRRKIYIWRTEKDKSFQKQYVEVSKKMSGIFYKGFTEKEMYSFENMLKRIFDNLKESE